MAALVCLGITKRQLAKYHFSKYIDNISKVIMSSTYVLMLYKCKRDVDMSFRLGSFDLIQAR